jgi:hypothetical protein
MINLIKFLLPSIYLIFLNFFVFIVIKLLLNQLINLYELKISNKNYYFLFLTNFFKIINYKLLSYEKKIVQNYLNYTTISEDNIEKKFLFKKLLSLETTETKSVMERSYNNLVFLFFFK